MANTLNTEMTQLDDIKQRLGDDIKRVLSGPALPKNRIVRLTMPVASIDIFKWLLAQKNNQKIYWSSRDGTLEVGGVGLAYALHGTSVIDYDAILTELERYLTPEAKDLRFFGGIAFDQKSLDKNWESFGTYRFILPRFEVIRQSHQMYFVCNFFADKERKKQAQTVLEDLRDLNDVSEQNFAKLPAPISRDDFPSQERWNKELKKISSVISQGALEKVVLARRSSFRFNEALNPIVLLHHLKKISPECFHFCFQFDESTAFIGASPERLYKRDQRVIQSEAIAGTRPRGRSKEEDAKLKTELLNSDKERREHMYVVDMIRENLRTLCASVDLESKVNLLPLSGGQHLLTSLEGLLSTETDDAIILKHLHPTPAVGGFPDDKALKAIHDFEPFKRGWYAGPVGYVGFDAAEFAVAIRSGLIRDKELFLYAGAGIIEGSSPQDEWAEIETKISNFTEIFQNGKP